MLKGGFTDEAEIVIFEKVTGAGKFQPPHGVDTVPSVKCPIVTQKFFVANGYFDRFVIKTGINWGGEATKVDRLVPIAARPSGNVRKPYLVKDVG